MHAHMCTPLHMLCRASQHPTQHGDRSHHAQVQLSHHRHVTITSEGSVAAKGYTTDSCGSDNPSELVLLCN